MRLGECLKPEAESCGQLVYSLHIFYSLPFALILAKE
jgi:hypothetical protein